MRHTSTVTQPSSIVPVSLGTWCIASCPLYCQHRPPGTPPSAAAEGPAKKLMCSSAPSRGASRLHVLSYARGPAAHQTVPAHTAYMIQSFDFHYGSPTSLLRWTPPPSRQSSTPRHSNATNICNSYCQHSLLPSRPCLSCTSCCCCCFVFLLLL